mgnify:CR=1 FL=1
MKFLSYFSAYQFYILALLLNQEKKFKQTVISNLFNKSTKYIRRFLNKTVDFNTLFLKLICILNIDLSQGFFSIDDTSYSKPFCRKLKLVSNLYNHSTKGYTKGYEIVFICWSNGKITLPISFRIWHSTLGKSKIDIGIELVKYARKISNDKNLGFRVDALYNAKKFLGYLHKNHLFFATRLGRGRILFVNGKKCLLKTTIWGKKCIKGWLPGIGYVWVTKYRGKYYCTNRRPDYQRQIYEWYAERWNIECVFRFVKSELKLQDCQAFTFIQHYNHIGYCFLTYGLLQASFPKINVYEAKRRIESMYVTKSVSLKQEVFQLCA